MATGFSLSRGALRDSQSLYSPGCRIPTSRMANTQVSAILRDSQSIYTPGGSVCNPQTSFRQHPKKQPYAAALQTPLSSRSFPANWRNQFRHSPLTIENLPSSTSQFPANQRHAASPRLPCRSGSNPGSSPDSNDPRSTTSGQAGTLKPPATPTGADSQGQSSESILPKNPESIGGLLTMLKDAWSQGVLGPLNNFGMGKRSVREGSVGLFMMSGVVLFALIFGWVQGVRVRSRTTRYQAVFEFSQACGIAVGTPVRIRGVDVGSVVAVRPSLEKIDAVVEILDENVAIPRNSLIEVNQSGLISETLIDITPQFPMPQPTVGPVNPKCSVEGLIVCDRERIQGSRGVSLDELVGICTKIAKEMDQQGVGSMFEAMDKFAALAEEAKPLVEKVNAMASDMKPILCELKDGELLKNLERLTGVALDAADEIRQLNSVLLSGGNTELLRESVTTLTKTLKHMESITADVSTLTGDPSTRNHLKQLIESLSRIVVD